MNNQAPLVITISRQLGAGGAYVGQHLARKLNIFYADREIISQAAKNLSLLREDLEERDEKILSFWQSFIRSFAFVTEVYVPPQIIDPTDTELFKTESEIIERIARESPAVIIGRCGSHILREHPRHVSIFLHAEAAFRQKRVAEVYGVPPQTAARMIAASDKGRNLYHHKFTGLDWADTRQYNLALNTGRIGIEKSVDFILQYVQMI